MADATELELLNRKIAADLLTALIQQGRVKPGGASSNGEYVIEDVVKTYQALVTGIHSVKSE